MQKPVVHTSPSSVPESPVQLLMRGMTGLMREKEVEVYQLQQERDFYREQTKELPQKAILAEGKQNELIAILNVLYCKTRAQDEEKLHPTDSN